MYVAIISLAAVTGNHQTKQNDERKNRMLNDPYAVDNPLVALICRLEEVAAEERSKPGCHKHKCGACKCVWEHPNKMADTREEQERRHNCPRCGRLQYYKYFGKRAAEESMSVCFNPLSNVPVNVPIQYTQSNVPPNAAFEI